jgi:hypothetical protein
LAREADRLGSADSGKIRGVLEPLHGVSPAVNDAEQQGSALVDAAAAQLSKDAHPAEFAHSSPKIFRTPGEAHEYGNSVWGGTLERLESTQRQLLTEYTAGQSTPINDLLRLGFPLSPTFREQVSELDRILLIQPTREWVRVSKTIQSGRLFPDVDIADVAPGYRGTFRDYVSTSMHPDGTAGLRDVERRDVDATIDVPPGTPAIYIGALSATPEEYELLLGRELDFDLTDIGRQGGRWQAGVTLLPR